MFVKILILLALFVSCETSQDVAVVHNVSEPSVETKTITSFVKPGEGLFQAMRGLGITDNKISFKLINLLRDEVEFSRLKVGDKLEASFDNEGILTFFSYSQNKAESHALKFNKETQEYEYSFIEEPTFIRYKLIEGTLNAGSTLERDLREEGIEASLVGEVVNVLLCKINFRMNARVGDRYRVLVSERVLGDEVISKKFLYTSYEGERAGKSEAFYYEDSEKASTYNAHYSEDGEALIYSALRYPLPRLHIRSNFGMRVHPVTGKKTLHAGVDLRGRVGEPVRAVAAGVVVESNYNEFGGNRVGIKHRDGSTSYYMHLNSRSVNVGSHVISNQMIGTVGATGRVTGPHLHFAFKDKKGKWFNPLNKRMIATPKLVEEKLENLKAQVEKIKTLKDGLILSSESRYILAEIPNQRVDLPITAFLSIDVFIKNSI